MKSKLIKCKTCGNDIAANAKQCPHCGAKMHQGVYTAIGIIVVITIFAIFTVLFGAFSGENSSNPDASETPISVSAQDLWQAYADNEVNADNMYKDKLISITGTVVDIGKDIVFESPCVSISSGDLLNAFPIQCFFTNDDQTDQIAALQNGQTVTITGRCTGLPVSNIQMTDCSLSD